MEERSKENFAEREERLTRTVKAGWSDGKPDMLRVTKKGTT
jgi:hypothetical protein